MDGAHAGSRRAASEAPHDVHRDRQADFCGKRSRREDVGVRSRCSVALTRTRYRLGGDAEVWFGFGTWVLTPPVQDFRRMMRVLRQFDERRKKLMPEPHWYLMAIGIEPLHQGKGFGSALVRSGMRRADRDGKVIYLETESEINVSFYERLGFEVIEEMTIVEIDLPFSLLIRRPVTPRT